MLIWGEEYGCWSGVRNFVEAIVYGYRLKQIVGMRLIGVGTGGFRAIRVP